MRTYKFLEIRAYKAIFKVLYIGEGFLGTSLMARISRQGRSRIMAAIRSKDTKPEKLLRSMLHQRGYRFRKNYAHLPGKPDIVFTKKRKIIFLHGCFWHNHGCPNGQIPRSRVSYWKPKLLANKARDKKHISKLRREGWSVLVIWECKFDQIDAVIDKAIRFLREPSA